ncbi:MAG: hypothetical protein L0241_03245 [Planctomycetia bacterium]|nr:hypothetical protein [Planctomycetia bacterium]
MPPKLREFLAGSIAFGCLIAFAVMYWVPIAKKWGLPECFQKPSDDYSTVATTLAGLVGGVVAFLFGQQLTPTPDPANTNRLSRAFGVAGEPWDRRAWIALAYTAVYFLTVFGALMVWLMARDDDVGNLQMFKNLGLIGLGLVVAISRAFFGVRES